MAMKTKKTGALTSTEQRAFEAFGKLPDEAKVSVRVVAAIEGVSPVTIWRRCAAGLLPPPTKDGGTSRWIVGALRAARAGE
jgi:predicted DNA-binding transcriptional regulator AlpA